MVVARAATERIGAAIAQQHIGCGIAAAVDVAAARQCEVLQAIGQHPGHAAQHAVLALAYSFLNHVQCRVHHVGVVAQATRQGVGAAAATEDVVAAVAADAVVGAVARAIQVG